MHNFFSHHLRRAVPLVAITAVLAGGTVAEAKPVKANLRVEAAGKALDPGTTYATDTVKVKTDKRAECGGTGKTKTLSGPTAMGILATAAPSNPLLRPLAVSDKFSFGLTVCGLGRYVGFGSTSYWLYKVNHKSPEIAAEQYKLKRGDSVLWFFQDTATKVNTGDELVLQAPSKAKPGKAFKVTVWAYDMTGARKPVEGASVRGDSVQTTDAGGSASITISKPRSARLRAVHGSDIASAPVVIRVAKK
jgi:hypothetical protein